MNPAESSSNTADRRIQTVCLLLLTAIGIGAALYFLRPVVIPFVLALFFLYCLVPAIDLQVRRLRFPRPLALAATLLLGVAVLLLLGHLVRVTADQISANAPTYENQLRELIGRLSAPLERLGVDRAEFGSLLDVSRESVRSVAGGLFSSVMSVLSSGVLVLLFLMFMILGWRTGGESGPGLRGEIEASVKRYVVAKVILSAVTGLLVGAVLAFLGVPFALVFGVLAFLLNFIPSLGSIIATLLPLPVVLLSPELSAASKILAIVLPAAIQFVVGNIVEPKVMGGSLGLHPVTILLGLMFFGMIWGIVGMLLAAPILAVLKLVLERIPVTAPVARLLQGRLGGAPPENRR